MRQSALHCGITDGGKWKLAEWIIAHFPKHQNYVEPCGGAASVLLQKPRSILETFNDLDGNIVNFFRVLRDHHDELIYKIQLTPWARDEYKLSLEPCGNEVEKARRFFFMCWMSMAGNPNSGWRRIVDIRLRGRPANDDLPISQLSKIANRLLGVQIENSNALDVIRNYDTDATLFYFDPPYVEETRTTTKQYILEWHGYDLHIAAAELLRAAVGYVVVSGYACPLYTDLYESHGWHRVDKEAQTNSGGKRVESLWISPRTWRALRDNHDDLPLFA